MVCGATTWGSRLQVSVNKITEIISNTMHIIGFKPILSLGTTSHSKWRIRWDLFCRSSDQIIPHTELPGYFEPSPDNADSVESQAAHQCTTNPQNTQTAWQTHAFENLQTIASMNGEWQALKTAWQVQCNIRCFWPYIHCNWPVWVLQSTTLQACMHMSAVTPAHCTYAACGGHTVPANMFLKHGQSHCSNLQPCRHACTCLLWHLHIVHMQLVEDTQFLPTCFSSMAKAIAPIYKLAGMHAHVCCDTWTLCSLWRAQGSCQHVAQAFCAHPTFWSIGLTWVRD